MADTQTRPLFTNQALKRLVVPLLIEQLLSITIGMADTVMVTTVGEAAVSGISLVDSINILLIQVFSALATGGAVVASQYLGRGDRASAGKAAKQLIYASTLLSLLISALVLFCNESLLHLIFGNIAPDVMKNAETYFWLSALSFPALAIYNSGAALFRSMGNSKVSMFTSLLMNVVNITGNAILIFGFHWGVAGAATATLASRCLGAVIMLILVRKPTNLIHVERLFHPEVHPVMIKNILRIGVPNGLENGMFQIGKLMVQGLVAQFGTSAIAAHAISNSVCMLALIPGGAINLAMITVVGQCVGANDYGQAVSYSKRLMRLTYCSIGAICLLQLLFAVPLVGIFHLSAAATSTAIIILRWNALFTAILWPAAFTLPNVLRAAGDARFTMITSVLSMWIFRIGFSYILARYLNLGLPGVWFAMYVDWLVRSVVFIGRFLRGKWKQIRVI